MLDRIPILHGNIDGQVGATAEGAATTHRRHCEVAGPLWKTWLGPVPRKPGHHPADNRSQPTAVDEHGGCGANACLGEHSLDEHGGAEGARALPSRVDALEPP